MSGPRRFTAALALGGVLVLASCDSGPQGPGVLPAKVTSARPLGAVVLEFTGAGITGFEARGTTQVFGAAGGTGTQKQRVILVSPAGATEIPFAISFEDRAADMPSVVAITAASPTNATVSAAGLKVRIER